jgi:subtilisin family serine protease
MRLHKLAAAMGAALVLSVSFSAMSAQPDPDRVIVKYKPGAKAQVQAALAAAGGRVHLQLDPQGAIAVSVPASALQALRNNPHVEYVEADAPRYPTGQVTPYGIDKVQAPSTWATGADGAGIKVCVIDSGIKADHEDFAGIAMSGYASSGQSWNTDTCGHGTHVAGTIAAANNSTGVVGVSPGKVSLFIVKVFDGASCGWSYASTLADAANRCGNAGAKVINMSLGGGTKSTTEENAFNTLNGNGVLSIAAAGNAGNTSLSYPASYSSVMSVAATDVNNAKASFSQYNSQVEIAAPGVGVLSTYPITSASMSVGGSGYIVSALDGSVQATASGGLVNGGRCTAAGSWAGKVVLCERGDISFADKLTNVKAGGGVAGVIYNNVPGGFSGTLNNVAVSIPGVSMSQEDGQALVAGSLGQTASVSTVPNSNASGYAYLDGTSMASPHVAGAAAIIWSADPTKSNTAVRNAMNSTALDLGAAGRDNNFGYGLVQTLAATEALLGGGGGTEPVAAPTGLTATNTGTVKGKRQIALAWSGGAGTVDLYRNNSKFATVSNTGSYTDSTGTKGTLTYKVCNAGTTSCSGNATVN